MLKIRSSLLVATAVAGLVSSQAQAQVALPAPGPNDGDASLHGAGASSIQNVLVRAMNCIGSVNNPLGNSAPTASTNGSFATKAEGNYAGAPTFDCTTQNVQPNFSGKYASTGSGFGRAAWYEFKDNFDGAAGGSTLHVYNPWNTISGQTRWSHVQFAVSDAPISSAELTSYTNGGTDSVNGTYTGAAGTAGAAIQIPLFILPVAVAYNPVYGKNASAVNMVFNAKYQGTINGVKTNAIRLTREAYCKIFNGDVTNWNDAIFSPLNGKKTLQDPVNDTATRWTADGVPIRLVGRMDKSGTTDVFTRHLAAVCTGNTTTTNKYLKNAESLPFNTSLGMDYTTQREDTNYKPGVASSKFAGTTNTVSGNYWNDTTKTIAYIGAGPTAAPTGSAGSGLYVLANGGGALANALNAAPDYALNGVTLNGKVGYISADFVPPSVDNKALAYALLQVGTGTTYAAPSVTAAAQAFGTGATALYPPESDPAGVFTTGDTRPVKNAAGATVNATRDNPLAWTDVLYVTTGGNNLAAPVAGYPITGTTQFLGYTCYADSNRYNVVALLATLVGGTTKDSAGAAISPNTLKGTSPLAPGVLPASNIGIVPTPWQAAIRETFLKSSTQISNGITLGGTAVVPAKPSTSKTAFVPAVPPQRDATHLALFIQSKYTLMSTLDTTKGSPNLGNPKSPSDLFANPTCSGKTGA